MHHHSRRMLAALVPLGLAAAVPSTARVAAAGTVARVTSADTVRRGYTAADVRFMQGMIAHHAQALAMTSLIPGRTTNPAIRLLAEKIDVSQKDEIASMRRWLEDRHEAVPDTSEHAMAGMPGMESHHALMPGMLTPEQMARLAAAKGAEFDRLFLTGMIQHHEGALAMVATLFATTGSGQEPQLFGLATDIDADQRADIARMRAMLRALPPNGGR
jgi:uncharacterized protein (DUF305 family)